LPAALHRNEQRRLGLCQQAAGDVPAFGFICDGELDQVEGLLVAIAKQRQAVAVGNDGHRAANLVKRQRQRHAAGRPIGFGHALDVETRGEDHATGVFEDELRTLQVIVGGQERTHTPNAAPVVV